MPTRRRQYLGRCIGLVVLAGAFPAMALARPPAPVDFHQETLDERLCTFPLLVTLDGRQQDHFVAPASGSGREMITGPTSITLTNESTGRTARLEPVGQGNVSFSTDSVTFLGRQVLLFFGIPAAEVKGRSTAGFDDFVLDEQTGTERLIDPCRLVDPALPDPVARRDGPPWDASRDVLGGIALAGLTPPWFGFVEHIHAHLDLFVDGQRVPIPAGVGIAEPFVREDGETHSTIGLLAPVHTHAGDGVLHVENDGPPLVLTLGDFFDVWLVRLTDDCVGSLCANGSRTLRVYENGQQVTGNPRDVILRPAAQITLVFGPPGVPAEIPASYDFPPGTAQDGFPGIP